MNAIDYRTEEFAVTAEDSIVIEWNGESRTIRTYTRGTVEPLYTGNSLCAAADSLDVDRDILDSALMGDPVVRDTEGTIVS